MTARTGPAFSGYRFPDDAIALRVRWYLRYRLSYADLAEWLAERGVTVDPSTIYDWVQAFTPRFVEAARTHCSRVGGRWRYVFRAIAERVVGALRHRCLGYLIILNEQHLQCIRQRRQRHPRPARAGARPRQASGPGGRAAVQQLGLSARTYHRVLKVARTISGAPAER
jgi:magnesium chelatase subunit ChlI-like protein